MYRKFIVVVSVAIFIVANFAQAAAARANSELRQQLESMQSLKGTFVQEVFDNGALLQESIGHFYLQRPAQLRWVTEEPEASALVADGETIWFYNPFIEQVTLYTQADAMQANPLLLLLDSSANWGDFVVSEVVSAEANDGMQLWQVDDTNGYGSSLVLGFRDGELQQLVVDDGQGQKSVFHLRIEAKNEAISAEQFRFEVPPGVDIDDQRE